jgi:aldehyde:ferredoxin oxidoreductase
VLFGTLNLDNLSQIYKLLTGIETTPEALKEMGERVYNLYRLLNMRAGFSRKDDKAPDIWFSDSPNPEGDQGSLVDYSQKKKLTRENVRRIIDDYYLERGWDAETGAPTSQTLKRLKLDTL